MVTRVAGANRRVAGEAVVAVVAVMAVVAVSTELEVGEGGMGGGRKMKGGK